MLNNNELKKKELIGNVYNLNEIINEFRMGDGNGIIHMLIKQTLYIYCIMYQVCLLRLPPLTH